MIAVNGGHVEPVFKCSTGPHFTAMIKANHFRNCPIAQSM